MSEREGKELGSEDALVGSHLLAAAVAKMFLPAVTMFVDAGTPKSGCEPGAVRRGERFNAPIGIGDGSAIVTSLGDGIAALSIMVSRQAEASLVRQTIVVSEC